MRNPFDQFHKSLSGTFLDQFGQAAPEHEIPHAPQYADLVFEPDGRVAEAPRHGWMGRMAAAGPCVIEFFSHPVRPDELDACIYKRDGLYQLRLQRARHDGRPRPVLPHLWVTTSGRPRDILRVREAERLAGWPPGFWTLRRGYGLHVVVLPELPVEPDTLMLRLLGRDAVLHQALQEAARLEYTHPLKRLLGPLVVAFQPHILQDLDLSKELDMHVFEQWQAVYNQWERETTDRGRKEGLKEGREEGRKEAGKEAKAEALLQLLEWRFGTVPEVVTARVARASKKTIDRWFQRALGAATLDDVFAR
jgi:hypothetical protein